MERIFVFLFGLGMGSFLNVVNLRLNTGEPILSGRSRCFHCGKRLCWFELIPLASFIVQRGRCRMCRSKISLQYPLVELSSGLLTLFFFLKWERSYGDFDEILILIWWLSVGFLLLLLSIYDLRHNILPDTISYLLIILTFFGSLAFSSPQNSQNFWSWLLTLLPALFLFLLWFFSRGRWMGLGDVKLMAAGGFFLGFPQSIAALLISFWVGALAGVLLLLFHRGFTLKSEIPFGPFLALGILTAFFFPHLLDQFFFYTYSV